MKETIIVSHPKSRMYYPKYVEVVNGFIQLVKCGGDSPDVLFLNNIGRGLIKMEKDFK